MELDVLPDPLECEIMVTFNTLCINSDFLNKLYVSLYVSLSIFMYVSLSIFMCEKICLSVYPPEHYRNPQRRL